ncbi:Cof-type HAD-IIB family hydrolase [Leuconostocaceae bacterium ESL0958]|nr:Cof-type HAD-IIB family hydrolase [Leuconostocaceae bacterium ESL0958]
MQNRQIKLVSIDIDGTLLNDQRVITPAVKAAVQAAVAAGVYVVITTGRPRTGVLEVLQQLDLMTGSHYVITHNGALVARTDGQETVYQERLPLPALEQAFAFAKEQGVYIQAESDQTAQTLDRAINVWASQENDVVRLPLRVVDDVAAIEAGGFVKALAIGDEKQMDAVQAAVPASLAAAANVVRSTPNNLEFMNLSASKGQAMLALAAKLDIEPAATMAIGDQENDLTMLEAAGLGVAMGNAVPDVKAVADVETADNNHDGVAKALDRYVLSALD